MTPKWLRPVGFVLLAVAISAASCSSQSQLAKDDELCEQNIAAHPEVALPHCTALVESNQLSQENKAIALIDRGMVYRNLGDYDRALQDFNASIKLAPGAADGFNNRGIVHDLKGDFDAAIEDYDQAIRLKPGYPDALNNRALVYQEKGAYQLAVQDFDQAILFKPDYAAAIANRAHLYITEGAYDTAISEYSRVIKLEPNSWSDFNDRAAAYLGKKEYPEALADLNRALALQPKNSQVLTTRGIVHFFLRQFREAEIDLTASLQVAPSEPSSVVWLYLSQHFNGEDARQTLAKNSTNLKKVWPEPAARLYLGALASEEFLAMAHSNDPVKDRDQQSQAYFFLGEAALIRADRVSAKKMFEKCLAIPVFDSHAHFGAVAELARLSGGDGGPHQE